MLVASLLVGLSGCALRKPAPEPVPEPPRTVEPAPPTPSPAEPAPPPASEPAPPPAAEPPVVATPPQALPTLKPAGWVDLPGWRDDAVAEAWPALLTGCTTLIRQSAWRGVCEAARAMKNPDHETVRAFFESRFTPWRATQEDGSDTGLVTGYYEPLIRGDRRRTAQARHPLYAAPDDLLVVDLASVYPELRGLRLRGRLVGNRVVPYATRAEIESGRFAGTPIAWANDPVELFFLQIQGSGRILLPDGSHLRVGYAEHNGHPYVSIGRLLIERGELKPGEASMQGIKRWGAANPDKLPALLAENPSFVFFRELPSTLTGPIGAQGVPLTAERSIAVDPRFIPLGAPVFLATTRPLSTRPLNRLVMAQDTGTAIKGGVRADYFWGFGDAAGEVAGRMKQRGRMWVLLPRDYPLETARR